MLREIKFRAWHSELGMSEIFEIETDLEALPEAIMQFTGVKDKNGKEIYESDIVKFSKHGEEHIGFINYWGCEWLISGIYKLARECNKGIEVIGNTFENPNMVGDFLNSED